MGDVIDLFRRGSGPDNVISEGPIRFRAAPYDEGALIQCLVASAERYEGERALAASAPPGHHHFSQVPEGYKLSGAVLYTALGLFRHRSSLENLRKVYRLAGIMECLIHSSVPILRTALIRDVFNKAQALKEELGMAWRSGSEMYLLPLHENLWPGPRLPDALSGAETLKELYQVIEGETAGQLDAIMANYVFYMPRVFVRGPAG